jgi:TonB-linked SusC/RagA family outer membrane protein
MKTKFNGFLTLLLALVVQISFAQTKTISGTVSDESGPLPGVSIIIKGTTTGAESDFDGKYSIKTKRGDVLVYSYLGYKTAQKTVGSSNTINTILEQDANVLDEVVITAYGTQTKESLTGSISEIKSEEFAKVASGSAVTGLTGKVAGVQIFSNSGQPGAAPTVRFRGVGTLNGSSSPLYVVDGVPFNESITSINPNDIESMSFLKDASASALYGNRGANGVIIVTTKKGKKGKVRVSFDTKTSFTSRAIKDYDVMTDAGEYYEAYWSMLKSDQMVGGATEADAGVYASENLIDGAAIGLVYNVYGGDRNTVVDPVTGKARGGSQLWESDWRDQLFNDASGVKSTYLSVSGGGDKVSYFFSLGHEDNTGYNVNTGFKRYTIKSNFDVDVTENLKTGLSFSYANRFQTGTLTNNITGNFAWVRDLAPIYTTFARDHATGELALDNAGNRQWDWAEVTSPNATAGRPVSGFSNPHALQTLNINNSDRDNMSTRAYARYTFLEDFTFTYNFGVDYNFYRTVDYTNKIVGSATSSDVNGRISEQYGKRTTFTNQQLLNWKKSFDDVHNVDILLGHETSQLYGTYIDADKRDQFLSSDTSLSLFAENDGAGNVNGGPTEYNLEGFFARAMYDYDGKYFLNGSIRRDGSSVFHPDNRWGNFWGAGAAWRISEEDFMSDISWISELKLKTSFGQQGNDVVYYDGTTTRNYAPYLDQWDLISDGSSFAPEKNTLGNEDLKWETSENLNVGFELNLFDNRLRIESEYFVRKITDLIFNRPLPNSTGLPSVPENVMDMQNTGVELSLGYDIINKQDLTWSVDINATSYKNEITKLAPGREFIDNGIYRWVKGGSAFDFYTYKYEGVSETTGHAIWATTNEFEADGVTPTEGTTEDRGTATEYEIGKSALPDVYGGISTSLTYKSWDFNVALSYQFGGTAFNSIYNDGFSGAVGDNFHKDYWKTWRPDNTTGTLPRVFDGTTSYATSDLFLESSDYISLNDIAIGYTLPTDVINKIGLSSVRLYGVANNIGLWKASDIQGYDPRASSTGGTDSVRYAALKTYTLGLTVNF